MRSDFYPVLQKHDAIVALKDAGAQLDLLPPGPAEIRETIQGPCHAAGLFLEEKAGRALADELERAACAPGSLPLLQFALGSLFDKRDRTTNTLRLDDYDAMGGIAGAIQERADMVIAALQPDGPGQGPARGAARPGHRRRRPQHHRPERC